MHFKDLLWEEKERIVYITINRPKVMNAISAVTLQEIKDACDEFENNPDLWVAILTGAGDKAFSAGHDIKWEDSHPEEHRKWSEKMNKTRRDVNHIIYYGAMYGGSTTSILINLPGETASVITCVDGYQMALQGRAGQALSIAAIGSFIAGTICTVIVALFGPPLANFALQFGSAEYCTLMLMGLVTASVLAHGGLIKSLAMMVLGLLFGIVGSDVAFGVKRFCFGYYELADGIPFVVLAVGLFAIGEIISNLSEQEDRQVFSKIGKLYPTWEEFKQALPPILRATGLGAFFGTLPGTTPSIAAFGSYMVEKKLAKDPSRFGRGAIEGVAAPEAANNADAQCKFIPMLTLGIPASGTMALMLGALMIQGIQPGPMVMVQKPDLFWGLIVSMWIGNAMLLVLNLPLVGLWVRLLTIPYRLLFPAIMVFASLGVYSTSNSSFDVYLAVIFGILGIIWRLLECSPIPLLLGFVLGPMIEENLRRALHMADGDPSIFVTRPISAVFVGMTVFIVIFMFLPFMKKRRKDIVG